MSETIARCKEETNKVYARLTNEQEIKSLFLSITNFFKRVWFGLVLWHIKHCRLCNAKSILYIETVLFNTIQFSIRRIFIYTLLNVKSVQIQTIQFKINSLF